MILIAEDTPLVADMIRMDLEDAGFCATAVASSDEAYRLVDREVPKAAVVDLKLADGMTGKRLAYELSRHGVPVVICTGRQLGVREDLSFCHAVLRKPAFPEEIVRAVQEALTHAHGLAGLRRC